MSRYFVGITGASGHAYATRLIQALVEAGHGVDLSITRSGAKVLRHELGVDAGVEGERLGDALARWLGEDVAKDVRVFPAEKIEAPAASGTAQTRAVILCPCSMGTLGRVAAGFSSNLVERAADVALKEGRTLLLVPRETPLSTLHLENLLRLSKMGAVVLPAAPGFYHRPESIEDLLDHVVGKALDRLGIDRASSVRWSGLPDAPAELPEDAAPEGSGGCDA